MKGVLNLRKWFVPQKITIIDIINLIAIPFLKGWYLLLMELLYVIWYFTRLRLSGQKARCGDLLVLILFCGVMAYQIYSLIIRNV